MTTVKPVTGELQAFVRSAPEAFLARRIIVCEGKTEVGLIRALDSKWSHDNDRMGLAYYGAIPIDGGGRTEAPAKAIQLAQLGYDVLLFADSDEEIVPSQDDVEAAGVRVVRWAEDV